MDELTTYIIKYYPHLMTADEAAAYRSTVRPVKGSGCREFRIEEEIGR